MPLQSSKRLRSRLAAFAVMLACADVAAAGPPWRPATLPGKDWIPVDPALLQQMRGGYVLPSGMKLSFGIERVVHVNGQLAATTVVSVPDISGITVAQARQLAAFQHGMTLQIGEGNHVHSPGAGGGALLIQNSLDNQDIRAATRVDVATDTLSSFGNLLLWSALGDALNGASVSP
jgi:hypothetical protein